MHIQPFGGFSKVYQKKPDIQTDRQTLGILAQLRLRIATSSSKLLMLNLLATVAACPLLSVGRILNKKDILLNSFKPVSIK